MWRIALFVGLVGCYRPPAPQSCEVACAADQLCPGGMECGADQMCHTAGGAACSDAGAADARPTCYGLGLGDFLPVCDPHVAPGLVTLTGPLVTDTDPRCVVHDQRANLGGLPVCLVVAESIEITGELVVTGSRPLALLATTTFVVDASATLDVASYAGKQGPAANDTHCAISDGLGGGRFGGGGAGGGFQSFGGAGAAGNANGGASAGPLTMLTYLHGGCAGSRGRGLQITGSPGGAGGGALYVIAGSEITVAGAIIAGGAGAPGAPAEYGGGGGGSGGMLVLEAPLIDLKGFALADGGAGAGGAGSGMSGAGDDAAHTLLSTVTPISAKGGFGTPAAGGNPTAGKGGQGSFGEVLNGSPGAGKSDTSLQGVGGAGGGGSSGFLMTRGTVMLDGVLVSPPPTTL